MYKRTEGSKKNKIHQTDIQIIHPDKQKLNNNSNLTMTVPTL